jgi:hypothetical protein
MVTSSVRISCSGRRPPTSESNVSEWRTTLRNMICFSFQLDCERKITLSTIGRIDVRSGNKYSPFCIKSLFLAECLTRLSASRRSFNLYCCSLRFRRVDSGTFPTNTFKTHSFILLIKSLPPAEIIAFLNFGFALFNTCRV